MAPAARSLTKSTTGRQPLAERVEWLRHSLSRPSSDDRASVPHYALAKLSSSIEERSSLSSTDAIKSFNCSRLVALTIGAVMLARASNHASDTRAGVALYSFAT